jgi:hypothetical protein
MPEAKAVQSTERFGDELKVVAARIETRLGWQRRAPESAG